MALWFPDWPVQAVHLDREQKQEHVTSLERPLAVVAQHRIRVCGHAARRRGVRRGMKVRQAQALCPELEVVDADPDRDGRMFEGIIVSLGEVAASVEVLRPGLVVVEAGAVARHHGSEEAAIQLLIDSAARSGVDLSVGVADELSTAVIATRASTGTGAVVAAGASTSFLAAQPLGVLVAEEALGCAVEVVEALADVGVRTLGELAGLPLKSVSTRFGRAGVRCHDIATARHGRHAAAAPPHSDLEVSEVPEEPILRVDAAAFVARSLAARLHQRLVAAGQVCQLLRVTADFSDGATLSRTWRSTGALTEDATADRVRWQLDGWLSSRGSTAEAGELDGITALRLTPLECVPPEQVSGGLWDTGTSQSPVVRQVIERVQSTLGVDAVLQPVPAGGRGVAERIHFVPFGETRDPVRDPGGRWPGQIPAPLPARLSGGLNHPAARVQLLDAAGLPLQVTAEALLSGLPDTLIRGERKYLVTGWAGPWPVDERWWEPEGRRYARLQVVGRAVGERELGAWLLMWLAGQWRIEASY